MCRKYPPSNFTLVWRQKKYQKIPLSSHSIRIWERNNEEMVLFFLVRRGC